MACQKICFFDTKRFIKNKLNMSLLPFCTRVFSIEIHNFPESLKIFAQKVCPTSSAQQKKLFFCFNIFSGMIPKTQEEQIRLWICFHKKIQNCSLNTFGGDRDTRQGGSRNKPKEAKT